MLRKIKNILLVIVLICSTFLFVSCKAITAQNISHDNLASGNFRPGNFKGPQRNGVPGMNRGPGQANNKP